MQDLNIDSFAIFGDGTQSRILQRSKFRHESGVVKWNFLLIPNKILLSKYPMIKEEINPQWGYISRNYADVDVKVVDDNPSHTRVWIFTTFNGDATPVSSIDDDKDIQILNQQKTMVAMEIENKHLHELLKQKSTPKIFIKEATEMIKLARSAAAKSIEIGKEEEEQ